MVSIPFDFLAHDHVSAVADKINGSFKRLGDTSTDAGKRQSKAFKTVATDALGLGVVGAAALVKMVGASSDFEKAMSAVGAATGKSGDGLKQLRDVALKAGADTKFSATEAAAGEEALAKAGLSVADIAGGALTGALNLAATGNLDVADSADVAATAMNQFGLHGKDVPHIVDLLAAGAGKAQGEVSDMGGALNYVGPIAHQMGISIEETTGTIAELASQGILGEKAGTGLRGVLSALSSPSAQAAAQMKDLGINVYDASGKFVGFRGVSEELHKALGGLTAAQRDEALGRIFGNEQIVAARILYAGGAADVDGWTKKVNDSGYATRQAAEKMNNLSGDVETLGGSIDTALIKGGTGANSVLRTLTHTATGAVNAVGQMPTPIIATGTALFAVGTAALLGLGAIGTVVPKIQAGRKALEELGPAGAKANAALGKVGTAVGAAGLAFTALSIAGAVLGKIQDAAIPAVAGIEQVTGSLLKLSDASVSSALPNLGGNLQYLGAQVRRLADPSVGDGVRKTFTAIFTAGQASPGQLKDATQNLGAIDKALAGLVTSGHAEQAKASFQFLATEAAKGGASVDQLKKALPGYTDALAGVANTSTLAAAGTGKVGTAAAGAAPPMTQMQKDALALGATLKDGATASDLLKSAIDNLNGANLDALGTDISLRDALAGVTSSIKENGRSVDLNTVKGRANLTTVSAAIKAAEDHAAAITTQTGSVAKGNTAFGVSVEQLRRVLTQSGMTKGAVDALIKKYAQIPKNANTSANLKDNVSGRVPGIQRAINGLNGKTVTIIAADLGTIATVQRGINAIQGKTVDIIVRPRGVAVPGLAEGGPMLAGRPYFVGERGPELVIPAVNSTVVPSGATRTMLASRTSASSSASGGPGPGTGVVVNVVVNGAVGDRRAVVAWVRQGIREGLRAEGKTVAAAGI